MISLMEFCGKFSLLGLGSPDLEVSESSVCVSVVKIILLFASVVVIVLVSMVVVVLSMIFGTVVISSMS